MMRPPLHKFGFVPPPGRNGRRRNAFYHIRLPLGEPSRAKRPPDRCPQAARSLTLKKGVKRLWRTVIRASRAHWRFSLVKRMRRAKPICSGRKRHFDDAWKASSHAPRTCLTAISESRRKPVAVSPSINNRRKGRRSDGAWGRIRTTDTRIFNPLLYQLSYPGERFPFGSGVYRRADPGCPALAERSFQSSSKDRRDGVCAPCPATPSSSVGSSSRTGIA